MRRKKAEREPEVNEEDVGRPNTISSVPGHSALTQARTHARARKEREGERARAYSRLVHKRSKSSDTPLI